MFVYNCIRLLLSTMTGSTTSMARVLPWPVRIHVMLSLLPRIVIPRQQVLENGTWIVEVFGPSSPVTYVPKVPPAHLV